MVLFASLPKARGSVYAVVKPFHQREHKDLPILEATRLLQRGTPAWTKDDCLSQSSPVQKCSQVASALSLCRQQVGKGFLPR